MNQGKITKIIGPVVDVLFDSLLADSGEGIVITSGWICSPRLFNSVFPQYLNRMGIIGG